MSTAFRGNGERIDARLERHEVAVLRELVHDVVRLVSGDVPDNPMTQRLFPDPSFDPVAAEELRGLIQDDLREGKRQAARTLLETLPDDGRVSLDAAAAQAWLTALNDVRLALGTALGVTEESDFDDPELDLYDWLTFLQGTLIEVLSR